MMKIKNNDTNKTYLSYIVVPVLFFVLYYLIQTKTINMYWRNIILICGINGVVAMSLNLINGITGQSCLGQAGFMSVGAYVSAMLTKNVFKPYMTDTFQTYALFVAALIIGGLAAGLIGFLIGLPSLRLRGDYLAIITLGFGEMIRVMWRVVPAAGRAKGINSIPKVTNFVSVYIIVFLVMLIFRNFTKSSYGRSCIAVRENELAGETMGINTTAAKIRAFVFAAIVAGIGGGLYSHLMTFINPDTFNSAKSTDYVLYLYTGGVGSFSSALLGAIIFTIIPEILRFMGEWRLVVYPLVLILTMIYRPKGLFGKHEFGFMRFGEKETEYEKEENAGILMLISKAVKSLLNGKKEKTRKEAQ